MISSNLHLKFETKQIQDGGSLTVRTFKEQFLQFQLLFPGFYDFHHVIWGMKWAKKLKTKNGQNMSSRPFSHDAAQLVGGLSNILEPQMATGSELVSYIIYLHITEFILLSIFSLVEAISLKIWERSLSWHARCSVPVSIHGSKMSCA